MSRTDLPEVIKIDDITNGNIDPDAVYAEIERLKSDINLLRYSMSQFLKTLATIPEGTHQQEYYKEVNEKLVNVQTTIKEYCAQYNRLLPVINFAQVKLDHEVEVPGKIKPKKK